MSAGTIAASRHRPLPNGLLTTCGRRRAYNRSYPLRGRPLGPKGPKTCCKWHSGTAVRVRGGALWGVGLYMAPLRVPGSSSSFVAERATGCTKE